MEEEEVPSSSSQVISPAQTSEQLISALHQEDSEAEGGGEFLSYWLTPRGDYLLTDNDHHGSASKAYQSIGGKGNSANQLCRETGVIRVSELEDHTGVNVYASPSPQQLKVIKQIADEAEIDGKAFLFGLHRPDTGAMYAYGNSYNEFQRSIGRYIMDFRN